jgi:hypothetical protein
MSFKCWKQKKSTKGLTYYVNLESGMSQWGVPANELLPAGWEMHLSKSKSDPFFTNSQKNIRQWNFPTKEDGNKTPEGWEEMRSLKCKSVYYKNTKTGYVQWKYPIDVDSFVLTKIVKPVGIGIPTNFLSIVEDCTQNKIWKKHEDKLLGSGTTGNIYIACKATDDCEYVIKIQKQNKDYYTEIEALLFLQDTKAVPEVFAAWTCENLGYFVIEKLYHCKYNYNFMWEEVGKKLDIVKEAGYLHVDIHPDNVMCKKDGTVVLIDFGYAVKRTIKLDKQEYPDNNVSQSYKLPLTWEYLQIIQENNHNRYFNPAVISLDRKNITKEQILADKKCTKKYNDILEEIILLKNK